MRPCTCGACRLCWLAENDDRYRELWGQESADMSTTGTHLKRLVRRFTGQGFKPGCSCRATIAQMNANTPSWSRQNYKMIRNMMRTEASRRGWMTGLLAKVGGAPIRSMIYEAVRLAELDLAKGLAPPVESTSSTGDDA